MLLYSADPYSNSRVDIVAQDFIRKLGVASRDFLIIEPYSIGDVYHTLSLLQSFRTRYLEQGARLFFLCQERATAIVPLFNAADVSVAYAPNELLCESFANRYLLAPGVPIVTAPDMHANGWLGRLCGEGLISSLTAKKLILGLDLKSPIHHAVVSDELRSRAQRTAETQGVQAGRSLIVFNHANTCSPLPVAAYRAVVEGFAGPVFTDGTKDGTETIPGTRPIRIPLDEVIALAEYAGSVLALRSGLVDVLSNARTRLHTIYPRVADIPAFFPDPKAVITSVRNSTLANIGLSDPNLETGIFLEDGDGVREMSDRIGHAVSS